MRRVAAAAAVLVVGLAGCGSQHASRDLMAPAVVQPTAGPGSPTRVTTTTTTRGMKHIRTTQAGSTSVSDAGSAPAPAAHGAPIRIGSVGTLSGLGTAQRGTVVAVQAWAQWINEQGGLKGHPVEVF